MGALGEFPVASNVWFRVGRLGSTTGMISQFIRRTPLDVEQQLQGRPCIGTRRHSKFEASRANNRTVPACRNCKGFLFHVVLCRHDGVTRLIMSGLDSFQHNPYSGTWTPTWSNHQIKYNICIYILFSRLHWPIKCEHSRTRNSRDQDHEEWGDIPRFIVVDVHGFPGSIMTNLQSGQQNQQRKQGWKNSTCIL